MMTLVATISMLFLQAQVPALQVRDIAPCFRKQFEGKDLNDPVVQFAICEAYRPLNPLCNPPVSPKVVLDGLKAKAFLGDSKAMWTYALALGRSNVDFSPEALATRLEWQEKAITKTKDPFWIFELALNYCWAFPQLDRREKAKELFWKAIPILEKMASNGEAKAIEILYYQPGDLKRDFGYDRKKWSDAAQRLRQKQAEDKDPIALFKEAEKQSIAAYTPEEMQAAIKIYEEAADYGSWLSIISLARLYRYGYRNVNMDGKKGPILVKKDLKKYKYWIQRGMETTACPQFGDLLEEGD